MTDETLSPRDWNEDHVGNLLMYYAKECDKRLGAQGERPLTSYEMADALAAAVTDLLEALWLVTVHHPGITCDGAITEVIRQAMLQEPN